MSALDPQRDPLEALAEDFTARLRRGENPSISEYAAKHADLADQIRELFPAIASMERIKTERPDIWEHLTKQQSRTLGD